MNAVHEAEENFSMLFLYNWDSALKDDDFSLMT